MKGYIYKITSPSGRIYIGQTINLESRIKRYKRLKTKSQPKLNNSLIKYGWDNHIFEVIDECEFVGDKNEILDGLEIGWIEKYNSFHNGLNCTKGGQGSTGFKHTEEAKRKMSGMKRNFIPWNKGKIGSQLFSEEAKKKMSDSRKGERNSFFGRSHSKESINKIKEGIKDRDISCFNKKVAQIDLKTKQTLKIWDSISDAGEFLTGKRKVPNISKVCLGKAKSAIGFYWKYVI